MDAPGKIIAGRYELVSPAGEGGMAVVWKAIAKGEGAFRRPVAIKRIQATRHADPAFIKMFEEEARVGSQLGHPNVVQILDFGRDAQGGYFLVMEWIEGLDLHQWVRSYEPGVHPTPWPLVAAIGIEVCRGLTAAHEREVDGTPAPVFHRDVSPSNILLATNGVVKLSDFGLARAMDRSSMTRPNMLKGKLAYSAPELIGGASVSAQTDLFALGVVLWEALAQRRLFIAQTDIDTLLAVRRCEVPPLVNERRDVPASLAEVLGRALAADPANRYKSALEMGRAFGAVLRTVPVPTDAEPIGASVRAARARLKIETPSMAPPAGMSMPPAPPATPSAKPPPPPPPRPPTPSAAPGASSAPRPAGDAAPQATAPLPLVQRKPQ